MARGINAVYSASSEKSEIAEDDDDEFAEDEASDINEILLKRLYQMGLVLTHEMPSLLVLIISNTPQYQFDIEIQEPDHVDIIFQGERPPSQLFHDLQEFIGLSPEEWGLESRELLETSLSVYPSKPLSTDKSKIKRKGYPPQMPLHYVVTIPFYVQTQEPNLHFDRLIIPIEKN